MAGISYMVDMQVEIAGIKLKNPVMVGSGTFGSGKEYAKLTKLKKLGAIVTKGVTLKEKSGNPPPRICETPSGILNSIGLQNKGVEYFLESEVPWLKSLEIPVIVNIAGSSVDEYIELTKIISGSPGVDAIEVNISCPNVEKGGMSFGVSPKICGKLIKEVKNAALVPIIVKLTPSVTDISGIAKTAEKAGADAISLINTFLGMAIDADTFTTKLAQGTGGLSGPAIKPIAVRMVWEVCNSVRIPVIGMGGIMTAEDALEFLLVGAKAVAVGTANFINPDASIDVINGLEKILKKRKIKNISEVIGKVKLGRDG